MKLFRDYLMPWWQVGLLKMYVLSIGLLLGAYFPNIVMQYKNILFAIFAILMIYFLYVMFSEKL